MKRKNEKNNRSLWAFAHYFSFADGHFYIECIGVFLAVSAEGARRDEEI